MEAIGAWLKRHGRAVYGTGECPVVPVDPMYHRPPVGVCTRAGLLLYVHLHRWPCTDAVLLPACAGPVVRAYLIGHRRGLRVSRHADGLLLRGLPPEPPDTGVPVVRIKFRAAPRIDERAIARRRRQTVPVPAGETVALLPEAAEMREKDGVPRHEIHRYPSGATTIGSFSRARTGETIWHLAVEKAGAYDIYADLGALPSQAGATFSLTVCGQKLTARNRATGSYDVAARMKVGRVRLERGRRRLVFRLEKTPYSFSDIHAFVLQPVRRSHDLSR
jgi:hypothetical protein